MKRADTQEAEEGCDGFKVVRASERRSHQVHLKVNTNALRQHVGAQYERPSTLNPRT